MRSNSENHIQSLNHKSLLSRKFTSIQVPEEEDSAGLAEDNFDNHVVPKTLQRRATRSVAAAIPFQVRKFVTDLWPNYRKWKFLFGIWCKNGLNKKCYRWTKNQIDTMLFFGWTVPDRCRQFIMRERCVGSMFNGFIFKKLNKHIEKSWGRRIYHNSNLPAYQHSHSSPIWVELDLIGCAY